MKWAAIICAVVLLPPGARGEGTAKVTAGQRVVAVTAFSNLNKDPAQDWLSTGVGETLTVKLARVPSLVLVERMRMSEAMKELQLNDTAVVEPATAVKLGKMVGAQTVVVGAIQKSGSELRMTARFVDSESGTVSNTAQADGDMDHVFDVQDKLAASLLETLGVQTTPEIDKEVKANPTQDVAAYEAYSKGVSSIQEGKYEDAENQLKQATEKDPGFQLARNMIEIAAWARTDSRSAAFVGKVGVPRDRAFNAMVMAVRSSDNWSLVRADRESGKIVAKEIRGRKPVSRLVVIELKNLAGVTGIRILRAAGTGERYAIVPFADRADLIAVRRNMGMFLRRFFDALQMSPVHSDGIGVKPKPAASRGLPPPRPPMGLDRRPGR